MNKIFITIKEKWAEYLIEGLVIVSGIIGAFMLDSWKDDQRQKDREILLLKELRLDLEETENQFRSSFDDDSSYQASRRILIRVIENKLPWNDTLQQHFNLAIFYQGYYLERAAYNSLESWGINNLSNDSLRRKIIILFQNREPYLKELRSLQYDLFINNMKELWTTTLDMSDITAIHPNNYQEFIYNEEFLSKLKAYTTIFAFNLQRYQEIADYITQLRKELELEIERLER